MLNPVSHFGDSFQYLVWTYPRSVKLAGLSTGNSRVKQPDQVTNRDRFAMNFGVINLFLPSLLTAHLFPNFRGECPSQVTQGQ